MGDDSTAPAEALAAAPPPDVAPRRVSTSNPRLALLIHLAEDLREAIVAGDIEAARVAHEAIGRLLGSATTQLAPIIDLARDRGDAGGQR